MNGSRAGSRARLPHGLTHALVACAVTLATLALPTTAQARAFRWAVNGSGVWNVEANWTPLDGGPAGFPDAPNDLASFDGAYTRRFDVSVNRPVTVGVILMNTPFSIRVLGPGPLTFASTNGPSQIICLDTTDDGHILDVPTVLTGPHVISVAADTLLVSKPIGESGVAAPVTKLGLGSLQFIAANTYTGATAVDGGTLVLNANALGSPVLGNLTIGNGNASDGLETVIVTQEHQLPDSPGTTVTVNVDGVLQGIGGRLKAHRLEVRGGAVSIANGTLDANSLLLIGGRLDTTDGRFSIVSGFEAISTDAGPAVIRATGRGALQVADPFFTVNKGPAPVDLDLAIAVEGGTAFSLGFIKIGGGVLRFSGTAANTYAGDTLIRGGRVELARTAVSIPGGVLVISQQGDTAPVVSLEQNENIADAAAILLSNHGTLLINGHAETLRHLQMQAGTRVVIGDETTGAAGSLAAPIVEMVSSGIRVAKNSRLTVTTLSTFASVNQPNIIDGPGLVSFDGAGATLNTATREPGVNVRIDTAIEDRVADGLIKDGDGVALLTGANAIDGPTTVVKGTLLIAGTQPSSVITVAGATAILGGTGIIGPLTVSAGTIAPGIGPGRLTSGPVTLSAQTTFAVEINGANAGTTHDQLAVIGGVTLNNATLAVTIGGGFTPVFNTPFTLVANDGTDPVNGTFAGLAQGARLTVGGSTFIITYRGGDGNDIALLTRGDLPDPTPDPTPDPNAPVSYFLAEGATGGFFDEDVLVANPETREAPITLTFLQEGGAAIVEHRTVPAQSRLTVHVDQVPGLADSPGVSVRVTSDNRVPLVVERTMFWDQTYYGGHTANAVDTPATRWIFAEGFQGFFDTFILIANANAEPTTATLTFLREGAAPFVTTVPVGAFARKTVYAGDYPELRERAFGVVVETTTPVTAERAMYFASLPNHQWAGGHVNTGIPAPSTSWFHAEGATGGFFSTFILLSNPQDTEAHVELRFLLDTGEVITRTKTLAAKQRLTIDPAAEGDTRLRNAAVSTVVQADVPIVSERSMYWAGDAVPLGEGHNSSGIVATARHWGLAEGRLGGDHAFDTFILLANPSTQAAEVTVTYLRESGAPIVKTYTVAPTSRFNIDVKDQVPELRESSFGARIDVTNDVPIAVERSMYWNANHIFWAGGSSALGTPLAPR